MEIANHKLENLFVFGVVYECRSLAKAIKVLGKSRTTIRSSLDVMKDSLGDALFVQRGTDLEPTPLAEKIYPYVQEIIVATQKIHAAASSIKYTLNDRKLRVSCIQHFFTFVPRIIDSLHGYDRNIEVSFEATNSLNRTEQLQRLTKGDLDILIDFDSKLFESCKRIGVWSDEYVVIYSPDHKSGDIRYLIENSLYIKSGIPRIDNSMISLGAQCGVELLDSLPLLSSVLFNGDYFTILPSMIVADWTNSASKNHFKVAHLGESEIFGRFSVNAYWNPLIDDAKVSLIKDAIKQACYFQSSRMKAVGNG